MITPGFCKLLALANREGAGNAGGSSRTRRCPGSDIRMMLRRVHLRMSEPKGHQQILFSCVALDLTFAFRSRGNIDANVKSATLALRAKVKSTQASHHRSAERSGIPCANGFTVSFVLAPETGLGCLRVVSAMRWHCRQRDISVGILGPHDFAVREPRPRLEAQPSSIASRAQRP
jgi:hypothetical protein